MAVEQQPKPQSDRGASIQIHVTPEGLEVQEDSERGGIGAPKAVTTASEIPWWARLYIKVQGIWKTSLGRTT